MKNKKSIGSMISLILALLSVAGAVLFVLFKTTIPFPLAELIAFAYSFFISKEIWQGILCVILYIFSVLYITGFSLKNKIKKLYLSIPLFFVLAADTLIHVYAFLLVEGYQFNYIVSALFDILLVMLLFKKEN